MYCNPDTEFLPLPAEIGSYCVFPLTLYAITPPLNLNTQLDNNYCEPAGCVSNQVTWLRWKNDMIDKPLLSIDKFGHYSGQSNFVIISAPSLAKHSIWTANIMLTLC